MQITDLDGDGDLDLVGDPGTPDLWWWENGGNGASWTEHALGFGGDIFDFLLADVDARWEHGHSRRS